MPDLEENQLSPRIVHIDTGLGWRGGQQQVYLLHRELLRRGIASALLARAGGKLLTRCVIEDLPVRSIRGRVPWLSTSALAVLGAARNADIIHTHDSRAAALATVARNRRLEIVCHRRVSYPVRGDATRRFKYRRVQRWIAVSEEIADRLRSAGVADDRIVVVPSSLDADALRRAAREAEPGSLREELQLEDGTVVVGVTGALERQKGHEVLIRAAPRMLEAIPSVVFVFLGDGRLRDRLVSEVARRGLSPAFRFVGFRSDVAAVTSLYTVAVLPSVDGEGSSAALKEAMALSRPVVASALPGNLEVLAGCGIEVPVADPEALANGVIRLLSDHALRQRLGGSGFKRADDFRIEGMTDAVVGVYRGLMSSSAAVTGAM